MKSQKEEKPSHLVTSAAPALVLVALMWVIGILSWFNFVNPASWGVVPRTVGGLVGIVTSPLVHGGFGHLISNTLPFFLLLFAVFFFYRKAAWQVLAGSWVLTGLWVWVGARGTSHVGASGLVYAFAAFLFFSGVFRRDVPSMILSLIVVFLYGGLVWGVLPVLPGVSWESHLFGAGAGALMAWWLKDVGKNPKKKYSWEDEPDTQDGDENAVWNFKKEFISPRDDD